jgi:hypothetical protein
MPGPRCGRYCSATGARPLGPLPRLHCTALHCTALQCSALAGLPADKGRRLTQHTSLPLPCTAAISGLHTMHCAMHEVRKMQRACIIMPSRRPASPPAFESLMPSLLSPQTPYLRVVAGQPPPHYITREPVPPAHTLVTRRWRERRRRASQGWPTNKLAAWQLTTDWQLITDRQLTVESQMSPANHSQAESPPVALVTQSIPAQGRLVLVLPG